MSYDGPGNPFGNFALPTDDDLDRILSYEPIATVAYHELPVGSYYILGGRYCYKKEDLKDPIRVPDIGDFRTLENFQTPGLQSIAQQMAWTPVLHIKPIKWNGPSPEELAGMSKKKRRQWEQRNKDA